MTHCTEYVGKKGLKAKTGECVIIYSKHESPIKMNDTANGTFHIAKDCVIILTD